MKQFAITRSIMVAPSSEAKFTLVNLPKAPFRNLSLWFYPVVSVPFQYKINYFRKVIKEASITPKFNSIPSIVSFTDNREFGNQFPIVVSIKNESLEEFSTFNLSFCCAIPHN